MFLSFFPFFFYLSIFLIQPNATTTTTTTLSIFSFFVSLFCLSHSTKCDDDDNGESSGGSPALWVGGTLTGREFHLRHNRPHTSTLVAPGQQGHPPWLNVADPQRGANELHLVGTNSFSLSPWVCPTMAEMVPGSKCSPHDLPDYPVGEDSRQMIAERVGGPLINTKVDQRGENAPLREGGNCNWGQEDPSWERPRQ